MGKGRIMARNNTDMLNGPLGGKIIKYALPLALTGILQQLFNAADVAVVGRFCGKEAMAAVGGNAPVIGLLVNLFVGISLGSNVMIARSVGQGKRENVAKAVHTSVIVALIGGLLILAAGEIFVSDIVRLLGVPEDAAAMSEKYLRIYLLGMPVILLYNFEAAIFRSCGNTKTPLMALSISGVANVLLNVFFVVELGMDADGVSAATVLSNLISSLILFIALTRTEQDIRLDVKKLRIDFPMLREIMKIGIPAGIQGMIFSFANIVIQSAVNSLGTTVVAASSAAFNLEVFAYYVMNSFGQACTTFVGQNYGAGKNDRCIRTLKLCIMQSFFLTASVCILIFIFGRQLLSIFNNDPDVIAAGYIRLTYIFIAYLFSFCLEVLSGYLRGFGISFVTALCSVVGICGVRLLWIFTVFERSRDYATIMMVYPVSLCFNTLTILVVLLIIRPSKRMCLADEPEKQT